MARPPIPDNIARDFDLGATAEDVEARLETGTFSGDGAKRAIAWAWARKCYAADSHDAVKASVMTATAAKWTAACSAVAAVASCIAAVAALVA